MRLRHRRRPLCVPPALLLLLAAALPLRRSGAAEPPPRPVPAIHHALIISVDGLRPDILLRANTPNMHALFAGGAYSFWAKTTELSVTLPSHTSMLTGVVPNKHGITFNDDGPEEPVYPKVPTLFQLAKKAGYTTALAASKSKFATLAQGVDWVKVPPRKTTFKDEVTAENAAEILRQHHPDVLFVHFGAVDAAGHAIGWGTPQQVAAVEKADACVGVVLSALKDQNLVDSTLVVLTADHGGTGRWHGPDDTRARHIPWIASGPGLRKGYDLTSIRELNINTEDTFATTCWMLAIPTEGEIDGKPVKLALEAPDQLLQDAPTPKKKK
jgi:arylsulfatase A-like enzyme